MDLSKILNPDAGSAPSKPPVPAPVEDNNSIERGGVTDSVPPNAPGGGSASSFVGSKESKGTTVGPKPFSDHEIQYIRFLINTRKLGESSNNSGESGAPSNEEPEVIPKVASNDVSSNGGDVVMDVEESQGNMQHALYQAPGGNRDTSGLAVATGMGTAGGQISIPGPSIPSMTKPGVVSQPSMVPRTILANIPHVSVVQHPMLPQSLVNAPGMHNHPAIAHPIMYPSTNIPHVSAVQHIMHPPQSFVNASPIHNNPAVVQPFMYPSANLPNIPHVLVVQRPGYPPQVLGNVHGIQGVHNHPAHGQLQHAIASVPGDQLVTNVRQPNYGPTIAFLKDRTNLPSNPPVSAVQHPVHPQPPLPLVNAQGIHNDPAPGQLQRATPSVLNNQSVANAQQPNNAPTMPPTQTSSVSYQPDTSLSSQFGILYLGEGQTAYHSLENSRILAGEEPERLLADSAPSNLSSSSTVTISVEPSAPCNGHSQCEQQLETTVESVGKPGASVIRTGKKNKENRTSPYCRPKKNTESSGAVLDTEEPTGRMELESNKKLLTLEEFDPFLWLAENHESGKFVNCSLCDVRCAPGVIMRRHIFAHSEIGQILCRCGHNYLRYDAYDKHVKSGLTNPERIHCTSWNKRVTQYVGVFTKLVQRAIISYKGGNMERYEKERSTAIQFRETCNRVTSGAASSDSEDQKYVDRIVKEVVG